MKVRNSVYVGLWVPQKLVLRAKVKGVFKWGGGFKPPPPPPKFSDFFLKSKGRG